MRRAAGVVSAVVVGAGVLAAPAPVLAGEPTTTTFQVTARTVSDHYNDVGRRGPSTGDSFELASRLFNGGDRVGRDVVKCDVKLVRGQRVDSQCAITMLFRGRGTLVAQGLLAQRFSGGGPRPTLPILGGTGQYQGAEGRFVLVDQEDGPTRYRIHLEDMPPV